MTMKFGKYANCMPKIKGRNTVIRFDRNSTKFSKNSLVERRNIKTINQLSGFWTAHRQ